MFPLFLLMGLTNEVNTQKSAASLHTACMLQIAFHIHITRMQIYKHVCAVQMCATTLTDIYLCLNYVFNFVYLIFSDQPHPSLACHREGRAPHSSASSKMGELCPTAGSAGPNATRKRKGNRQRPIPHPRSPSNRRLYNRRPCRHREAAQGGGLWLPPHLDAARPNRTRAYRPPARVGRVPRAGLLPGECRLADRLRTVPPRFVV